MSRLSAAAPDPAQAEQPAVDDIAARIKALKAGLTREVGTQRNYRKVISADEPVTARIFRGVLVMAEDDSMPEDDLKTDAVEKLKASSQRAGADVSLTSRDRLARERLANLEEQRRT